MFVIGNHIENNFKFEESAGLVQDSGQIVSDILRMLGNNIFPSFIPFILYVNIFILFHKIEFNIFFSFSNHLPLSLV